ncbi:unnamed protein product [Diplocarpon coronariae]|nr:hypothetical protein JHW43_003559 [Diplocarpon mali]
MVWEDDAVELQRVRQTSTTSHLKLPYFSNPRGMTGAQPSQSSNAHSSSRLRPSSDGAWLPAHGMLLRTPRRIALSERTFPTSNTQNSAQGAQHPSSRSQALAKAEARVRVASRACTSHRIASPRIAAQDSLARTLCPDAQSGLALRTDRSLLPASHAVPATLLAGSVRTAGLVLALVVCWDSLPYLSCPVVPCVVLLR